MDNWENISKRLPDIQLAVRELRETLLSNLIIIGELPAPTFNEENRIRFLQNRFAECGIVNCCTDEVGNGLGIIEGQANMACAILQNTGKKFLQQQKILK